MSNRTSEQTELAAGELWVRTIDANWSGAVAEAAKRHAARVGASLTRQLLDTDWHPTTRSADDGAGQSV